LVSDIEGRKRLRVLENKVLRRIFGPQRDEMIGSWTKPHTEELHNLHSPPSIIRMIKSRLMKWKERVACTGRRGIYIWGSCGKARRDY
jgi:hypothetical protein